MLSVVSSIDEQGKLKTSLSMEGCESLNHYYAALDIRLRFCTLVCPFYLSLITLSFKLYIHPQIKWGVYHLNLIENGIFVDGDGRRNK